MRSTVQGGPSGFIQIGTQIWTKLNLNLDHYKNGDIIPEVTDPTAWANLTTGAWCYYNNDSAYGPIYGKLYNWYAVNDPRGLGYEGFHVPTNSEYITLRSFLGGLNYAGGKLKETGNTYWFEPNTGTNESGFSMRGGSHRVDDGTFGSLKLSGQLWTTTEIDPNTATKYYLAYNTDVFASGNFSKKTGYSVRLIKDN